MRRVIPKRILLIGAASTLLLAVSAAEAQTAHAPETKAAASSDDENLDALNSGLGIAVSESTGQLKITGTARRGVFTSLGLQTGDVIAAVNGRPVFKLADMVRRLSAISVGGLPAAKRTPSASLMISRQGRREIVNVPNATLSALNEAQTRGMIDLSAATASANTTTPVPAPATPSPGSSKP